MNKPFLIFKKQKIYLKVMLLFVLCLIIFQLFSFITDLKESSKFIPVDIKVVSLRFESGYEERYFYDTYLDLFFDRDLTDKDMGLFGVSIEGESVEISKFDDRVIRVIFRSDFNPKQERHLKVSYGGSVFFEKYYQNEGFKEKEALENLPRSLNVE